MAHDAFLGKVDHGDVIDALGVMGRGCLYAGYQVLEAVAVAGRPVPAVVLHGVAGNHELAALADACKKHEHLCRGAVLSLIHDDEGVLERAAAHHLERADLDDLLGDEALEARWCHVLVEHVSQRHQPRAALLLEGTRKKADTGAVVDVDHGPRDHELVDGALDQLLHGHRAGDHGLARACGAGGHDNGGMGGLEVRYVLTLQLVARR